MKLLGLLCLAACADAADPTCEPGTGATRVTIHTEQTTGYLDRQAADAAWVAVRDGADEACGWETLPATRTGEYIANVTRDRYSIVIACTALDPTIRVVSRSTDDPLSITELCTAPGSDAGVHKISAHVATAAAEVVTVQPFLLDTGSVPNSISGSVTDFIYEAKAGSFDLVAFGDVDSDPQTFSLDGLLIARDLDIATDPVIDINPRTAGYGAFGAALTTIAETGSNISISYVTSHGTVVALGGGTSTATYPSWPADKIDPGDAYQLVTAADFGSRFTQRFARDPSGVAPAAPSPFDPDARLVRREDNFKVPLRLEFARAHGTAAAPAAAQYVLDCRAEDHRITYDLSAGWLGDGERLVFEIPELPADPAVPELARALAGCDWNVSAIGSPDGLEIEDELARVGREAGAPALHALFDVERWVARAGLVVH